MAIARRLLDQFARLPAATVYEGAGKAGDLAPDIGPLHPGSRLCGPAFTVRCFPGDFSAMMRAVDEAEPGDVLVIDVGSPDLTAWGGSGSVAAVHRKLGGVVTDARVRDSEQIAELGFPVFCRGASVRGGQRNHKGWTGIPVSVGGAVVRPGDLVLGDADGVVVVEAERLEEVLENSLKRRAHEEEAERRLGEGLPYGVWTGVAGPARG